MESSNWMPAQSEPSSMEATSSDWRSNLLSDARQRIVNKIMDTLRRHLPVAVPEGMTELKKIAIRFEEKIYQAATSQSDYLRKISLKMLSMETKTQQNNPMNLQSGIDQNSTDTGSIGVHSQVANQGVHSQVANQGQALQQIQMVTQPSSRQQILAAQNMQNNTAASSSPSIPGLSQPTMQNFGHPSNMQNMPSISVNSSLAQGTNTDIYANAQRQIQQGRQQQQQQQQQQQVQNPLLYQNSLQPQAMKQKLHNSSLMQPSLMQTNQIQPSQQSLMQMSSGFPSGQPAPAAIQSASQPILQQNQLNSNQQSASSLLPQQMQAIARQSQQTPLSSLHQQSSPAAIHQQSNMIGQQANLPNIQQQRHPIQQNGLVSMQQSQQLLNQQAQQQQQQLLGSLQSISNLQSHQRSIQLLQQSKNMAQNQQQMPQPSMPMMQAQGGQQAHHLPQQQQMMSQFQSQQGQLPQPNSMQREMQQRLQASGGMLQSQAAMEQQKQQQFMQSQRAAAEVSSSVSVDSSTQAGLTPSEAQELFQKLQVLKETYLAELQEFYMKISQRFQQNEMMPHAKQSENFEKLRNFKGMLERIIALLQMPKSGLSAVLKEKLPQYEKQILNVLSSNRRQKAMPSQPQQFQHPGGHLQASSPQVLQAPQHENSLNQAHQMGMSGSIQSMQPSSLTSGAQHGSMTLTGLTAQPSQQNAMISIQPTSDLDPAQVNAFGSVQQSGGVSLQNSSGIVQQGSMNAMQPNANAMQNSNVNVLQQQMQNQQLKQQFQQRQIQQQLLQQQQRQQLLQQQLQQQQKQQQQQQQQQQALQLPGHQLHPMSELNEMKARQGTGMKPAGIYQQQSFAGGGQRHSLYHQQLNKQPGSASFPIASPQNLQASSPQISHHSSPQIDQHALLPSAPKTGTPLQSTGSPFVVPSPSTPVAPSPVLGDSEKMVSNSVTLINTGQTGHQQAGGVPAQTQAIAVATPGISASPLLAEFTSQDGSLLNSNLTRTELPMERLVKAVQSLSPKALRSAVGDISSVVSMVDRIAGSAPGNGSRAAVGEDLVAMTKCRLQARNFMSQDGAAAMKKMKRHTSAMPLNNASPGGSLNDNIMKFGSIDLLEMESTATSRSKRQKVEIKHVLEDEIREINQQLIDTVVSISVEDSDTAAVAASDGGEGTIVKCSFGSVAFSSSLKAHFASMNMPPITPLKLLIPSNYPKCSPLLLEKLSIEPDSKELEDLSMKARSRFGVSLRGLSQPMSIGEMAGMWDRCARKVVVEYAQRKGGGCFSSTYGTWESCIAA